MKGKNKLDLDALSVESFVTHVPAFTHPRLQPHNPELLLAPMQPDDCTTGCDSTCGINYTGSGPYC